MHALFKRARRKGVTKIGVFAKNEVAPQAFFGKYNFKVADWSAKKIYPE